MGLQTAWDFQSGDFLSGDFHLQSYEIVLNEKSKTNTYLSYLSLEIQVLTSPELRLAGTPLQRTEDGHTVLTYSIIY